MLLFFIKYVSDPVSFQGNPVRGRDHGPFTVTEHKVKEKKNSLESSEASFERPSHETRISYPIEKSSRGWKKPRIIIQRERR